jgi:hypothetical protein
MTFHGFYMYHMSVLWNIIHLCEQSFKLKHNRRGRDISLKYPYLLPARLIPIGRFIAQE